MKAPELTYNMCFAVPIVQTQYPKAEQLNPQLEKLFIERAGEGDKYRNPHMTGGKEGLFESDFNVFSWPDKPVQELRRFILSALVKVVADLNQFKQPELDRLEIFTHTWFHVTYNGGYTRAHNHPMASWSIVYCIDPGETSPEHPDSGILRFEDIRHLGQMYLDPANMHMVAPYGFGSINYKLEAGQLYLFPSYLVHEVAPYFGSRPRITLSSNTWFKMDES